MEQAQARPAETLIKNSPNISEHPKPVSLNQNIDQTNIDQINTESTRVKAEIKKILITIGVMIAVIVTVYFINQKTDLVLKAGKYLAKALNINL